MSCPLTHEKTVPVAAIYAEQYAPGSLLRVQGWVRTARHSKKISFVELNDGSTNSSLQLVIDKALFEGQENLLADLTTGASIGVVGELVVSPGSGQKYELLVKTIAILGTADPETYPLQKKDMSFEYLREIAHLRPRTATFASMFRLRSLVSQSIHRFFEDHGFFYVHTPILTTTDGEGAGEAFTVTNLPLNKPANFQEDFFKTQAMLCVTGQLEAELLAMGMGKVYTFGPTFRAENSNTSRHLAEFWMIEPEMAFASLKDIATLAQDLVRFVAQRVLTLGVKDLEQIISKTGIDTRPSLEKTLSEAFIHVSYTEAVDILKVCGRTFEYPVFWGCDLKSEHERFLCEEHFKAPTVVYDYPEELKAFYMRLNEDQKTVRAMDILVPGIGEIVGGSEREDRLAVLENRMRAKGLNPGHFEWYLDIRRYGNVPHAGFGLGLERLLMWITGMPNIRDVIPFPRVPGNCEF